MIKEKKTDQESSDGDMGDVKEGRLRNAEGKAAI